MDGAAGETVVAAGGSRAAHRSRASVRRAVPPPRCSWCRRARRLAGSIRRETVAYLEEMLTLGAVVDGLDEIRMVVRT